MTKKIVYLGLDGGGTSTTLTAIEVKNESVLKKEDWIVLGRVETEGSNVNSVGLAKAKEVITSAFKSLMNQIPFAFIIKGIGCGMAGHTSIKDHLATWILECIPAQPNPPTILIRGDTQSALASGTFGDMNGIILISGTGMNTQGMITDENHAVSIVSSGGWGPLLGDYGSGYEIGRDVLREVTRMHDGFIPKTALYDDVLDHFDIHEVPDLIGKVYKDTRWNVVASCARLAFALYESDAVATAIVDKASNDLLQYILHIASKMQSLENSSTITSVPLILCGSILTHSNSPITMFLKEKLSDHPFISKVLIPPLTPELGAALMVYKHLNSSSS